VSINKKSVAQAKQRLVDFLEQDVGVTSIRGFDRHPVEDIYYLRVDAPGGDTLRVLDRVDRIVSEIANQNDFMIVVVPYPKSRAAASSA
jgi:hypothetical protein